MKNIYQFFQVALVLGSTLVFTNSANAQCNVGHTSAAPSSSFNDVTKIVFGQGFTATCSGPMTQFKIVASEPGNISADSIRIYPGNTVLTTPVYTQAVPAITVAAAGDTIVYNLTTPFVLMTGSQYTFEFTVDNVDFDFDANGTYTGGSAWQDGQEIATADIHFKILMTSNVGLDENESGAKLSVVPNPSSDKITIEGLEVEQSFTIFNMLGAIVQSGSVNANTTIDVQNLKSGVYALQLEGGKSISFVKE